MRCTLMNQNTEVLDFELDANNNITRIYKIHDLRYAPLAFINAINGDAKNPAQKLNGWFSGRAIPSWRKDLARLLRNLGIKSPQELLDKAYGLSLSDQYWFKETRNRVIKWENINFFTNNFESDGFMGAFFDNRAVSSTRSLKSPNNTTAGMLQKAWTLENSVGGV